jgi:hypothetical protein
MAHPTAPLSIRGALAVFRADAIRAARLADAEAHQQSQRASRQEAPPSRIHGWDPIQQRGWHWDAPVQGRGWQEPEGRDHSAADDRDREGEGEGDSEAEDPDPDDSEAEADEDMECANCGELLHDMFRNPRNAALYLPKATRRGDCLECGGGLTDNGADPDTDPAAFARGLWFNCECGEGFADCKCCACGSADLADVCEADHELCGPVCELDNDQKIAALARQEAYPLGREPNAECAGCGQHLHDMFANLGNDALYIVMATKRGDCLECTDIEGLEWYNCQCGEDFDRCKCCACGSAALADVCEAHLPTCKPVCELASDQKIEALARQGVFPLGRQPEPKRQRNPARDDDRPAKAAKRATASK